MYRLFAILCLSLFLLAFAWTQAVPVTAGSTATPAVPTSVIVAVNSLRLRAGPGLDYAVLSSLPRGALLRVSGRSRDGGWLAVQAGARSGWVAARYVRPVAQSGALPSVATTPPAPTPAPAPTPVPAQADIVVLGPGTAWPVRAQHVIGWGYEFVDASQGYDLVLHRDVYGQVAHTFWGSALYDRHPHGIRFTLIDAVWEEGCPSPVAPVPLAAGSRCLIEGFGDGAGAMLYAGCAVPADHLYDPQECYLAITADGEHLSDIVVAATITAQNMLESGYWARTPDFSQAPFTPLFGEAYREGDQWRWREPYLDVMKEQ